LDLELFYGEGRVGCVPSDFKGEEEYYARALMEAKGDIEIIGWWAAPTTKEREDRLEQLVGFVFQTPTDRKNQSVRGWWWVVQKSIVRPVLGDEALEKTWGIQRVVGPRTLN
jgi:hypothetical protein